ncbi:hypothetical protein [uncultured Halopseudomonas sp.]|uniref:hypothetical protein n=1 Tax=uncultured Halopseudomonas sp. TaxID=2901193 RepID=UPI0030EDD855|tara:strand:+ start:16433 stop:16966 length:534 start_codon:yes stop_codon:yes gene_type:complete
MQMTCPCCSQQFPFEAGLADEEGKRLAALFADMPPKLGKAVLSYLRLFSPPKRSLKMGKAIRLVEDLHQMVSDGTVTRDARTNDRRQASPALWVSGIEQMIAQREKLTLPLETHHYLRAVVHGIAGDAAAVQALAPRTPKAAAADRSARDAAYYQIQNDLRLKLISQDEADKRLKEL